MDSKKNIPEYLSKKFEAVFNERPLVVRSPGRINIIGEHTDYNEGFVLPAAVDKAAYIAVSLRADDEIHLIADDLAEKFSISIEDLKPVKDISWPNYILGPVAQLIKAGIPVKGFNAMLGSNVPVGAGLSSSAAVECATIFALNELLHSGLDKITMVKMAQAAEHEYPGLMCGIMDMFASMMGKKDNVIKLDCRSLEYEYVPFKLDGIKVVLFDTNVKHSLASSEYNTRRKECTQAVAWVKEHRPEVHSLRDVTEEMLDKYVLPVNRLVDKRARFVVQEIQRLQDGCEDLQKGDMTALGKKMFATHDGLSQMYGVSCAELDFLVDAVRNYDGVIGARMMGGGFGGCTINLVKEPAIEKLVEEIKPLYEQKMKLPFTVYIDSIEDGTGIVNL
ncbi:MAG TPA: galactokinase [Chitinophagaceae bacterium]|nr:galactokinase [Chitinophagaceae bacterium]